MMEFRGRYNYLNICGNGRVVSATLPQGPVRPKESEAARCRTLLVGQQWLQKGHEPLCGLALPAHGVRTGRTGLTRANLSPAIVNPRSGLGLHLGQQRQQVAKAGPPVSISPADEIVSRMTDA